MTEEEREKYEREVETANNIKAVINSKGWKETVIPIVMAERDKLVNQAAMSSDINMSLKFLWTIGGIDCFLALLGAHINNGEYAREILKKADTVSKR